MYVEQMKYTCTRVRKSIIYIIFCQKLQYFEKMVNKITFLVKTFGQYTKHNFELKLLKLHENHIKKNVKKGFSNYLIKA